MPVPGPLPGGNAPLPAGRFGRGDSVGQKLAGLLAGPRLGRVADEPMRPVVKTDVKRLADQKPSEATAIKEKITFEQGPVFKVDPSQKAGLAVLVGLDDFAFLAMHAALFGITSQIGGISRGIEMIGVSDMGHDRSRIGIGQCEFSVLGGHRAQAEILDRAVGLIGAMAQPVLVKINAIHIHTDRSERVEIGFANPAPVHELDAQLEGAVCLLEEFGLGNAQHGIEVYDVRDGRLANTDGADLIGFHQSDAH